MILREVTHHGDFRRERTVEYADPLTRGDVAGMLASCIYPYTHVADERLDKVHTDLTTTGHAEHGWTRWDVTDG